MSLRRPASGGGAQSDGHEGSGSEGRDSLSDSEIFDVLRNSRRRDALVYLHRNGGEASLRELTKYVASQEYDVAIEEVSTDQHKRVYTGLYQCHLPRLDEFGVVEFDEEEKRVTIGDAAPELDPYVTGDDSPDTVRTELVVAAGVGVLVVAGVLGGGPMGQVGVTSWALFTVVALFGLALWQLRK